MVTSSTSEAAGAENVGDLVGLRHGEAAAPRAEAQGHAAGPPRLLPPSPNSSEMTSIHRWPWPAFEESAQLDGGGVENLVHDALGERLQRLPGLLVGAGEAGEGPAELGLADLLELLAQGDDGRDHFEAAQAIGELRHLALHERLRLLGLALPLAQVGLDHGAEIVHVVDEDILEIVHGGIDVARHGDVDEEEGRPRRPGGCGPPPPRGR